MSERPSLFHLSARLFPLFVTSSVSRRHPGWRFPRFFVEAAFVLFGVLSGFFAVSSSRCLEVVWSVSFQLEIMSPLSRVLFSGACFPLYLFIPPSCCFSFLASGQASHRPFLAPNLSCVLLSGLESFHKDCLPPLPPPSLPPNLPLPAGKKLSTPKTRMSLPSPLSTFLNSLQTIRPKKCLLPPLRLDVSPSRPPQSNVTLAHLRRPTLRAFFS